MSQESASSKPDTSRSTDVSPNQPATEPLTEDEQFAADCTAMAEAVVQALNKAVLEGK